MKKGLLYLSISFIIVIAASCKKNNLDSTDVANAQLSQTELKLKQDYEQAENYHNVLLQRHAESGMTMDDPLCKMNDSLFHINDTSFTIHMHEYCLEMMAAMGMDSTGMGTLNPAVLGYLDKMQAIRKSHRSLHK